MIRFLAVLGLCSALATSAVAQESGRYGYTISLSNTDPLVNTGAPTQAPIDAYLWLYCTSHDGMPAAEFALEFLGGDGVVHDYQAMSGFLNAGTATQLLLAVSGCVTGPQAIGRIHLEFFGPDELCIVPDDAGFNLTMDCDSVAPLVWPNHSVGLTSRESLSPECDDRLDGVLCFAPVSVEPSSWGGVKALYLR